MKLKEKIKAEAKALGFVLSGVAAPISPPHYGQYLEWLSEGCHAEMNYLARPAAIEAREYPHKLLPEVRSILCLGMPYPPPAKGCEAEQGKVQGSIAAYAVLADYHVEIKGRLAMLQERIENLAGRRVSSFPGVDTSPILEKDYAQMAGLGRIGTNSCLINPVFGSWVFLAELLLDLPLEPDDPLSSDACQNCQRCVMACPTKALRPNRSVDARLCLSYLTIEHRGSIPEGLRNALGTRIFGCDACQAVCPSNQAAVPEGFQAFSNPILPSHPDLLEAFALSEAEFKARYALTPVLRARFQGFRRNIALALGNSRSAEALKTLQLARESEKDTVVLESIEWAIQNHSSFEGH